MANKETTKATTDPTTSTTHSKPEKAIPAFISLYPLAPIITGIAIKNENSAAIVLEVPNITAPKIVDPDLDVPGIKARTWKKPIHKAVK